MCLPKEFSSIAAKALEEFILRRCLLHWHVSKVKHKENDSQRVNVDCFTLVILSCKNLWGHISEGSDSTLQPCSSISSCKREQKSEVSNLDIIVSLGEKDIFWFKIPMAQAHLVNLVNSHEHLLEEVAGDLLAETTMIHKRIQEFTSSNVFHDDVCNILRPSWALIN